MRFKMPLNRIVAFAGPYITAVAGAVSAWAIAKANVLGIPGLDQANLQTYVAGALSWLLVHGAGELGRWQWLRGHHIELEALSGQPPSDVHSAVEEGIVDGASEDVPVGDLPSDAVEFASPPSDESAGATEGLGRP